MFVLHEFTIYHQWSLYASVAKSCNEHSQQNSSNVCSHVMRRACSPYPEHHLFVPCEIERAAQWKGLQGGMARGGAYQQQRKPGRIIPAGATQVGCPEARTRSPRGNVDRRSRGTRCAPCCDNPSLSGSLPPGEWRTINFTTPPPRPGQWSVGRVRPSWRGGRR